MGAKKYSISVEKNKTKRSCKKNDKKLMSNIKNLFLDDQTIFDFENPILSKRYPIDSYEFIEMEKSADSDSTLIFNLPTKATYIFNNATKFFVSYSIQKSKKKTDGTFGEWEPCVAADSQNIVLYDGFLRKKFDISYYENDLLVKINQDFNNITPCLESFLWAHMYARQRETIFGNNTYDISKFCFLRKSDYVPTKANYKKYTDPLFNALPFLGSFVPFFSLPYSNRIDSDGKSLKNFIIPNYENKSCSIRLKIKSDQYCFYTKAAHKDTIRYRLNIGKVVLFLMKFRFKSRGYNVTMKDLMGPCPNKNLLCPSFIHESFIQKCNSGDTYLQKTLKTYLPTKILIFKANSSLITGPSETYPTTDINAWMTLNVVKSQVHIDGLSAFNETFNLMNQSDKFAKYFGLVRNKQSFLHGYELNSLLNMELLNEVDYFYPHLLLDFTLFGKTNQRINPVLGNDIDGKKVTLDIRLDFDADETVTEGVFVFILLFEDKFFHMNLKNGNIENPLLINKDCK